MKKTLLLIGILSTFLGAKIYTLSELSAMPQSISKDFFIWRFIDDGNSTKEEALKAYSQTYRKSAKIKKAIRKKVGYLPEPDNKNRSKKDPKNFIIYPKTASNKSLKSLRRLYKKIQAQGKYSDVLKMMTAPDPFVAFQDLPASTQSYIFNGVTFAYRLKRLNHRFSKEQLYFLAQEPQFNRTLHMIITHKGLDKIKSSLLYTPPIFDALNFKSRFLLAMNALKLKREDKATYYLEESLKRAKYQSQRDQVNFWLYLITKKRAYLERLYQSNQVNLYTLRARDILNKPYPAVITPHLPVKLIADFDLHNPIDWEKIKKAIKEENSTQIDQRANGFDSYHTEGVYSYLKEKATNYTKPYYAMPYIDAMMGKSKERIALIYAIARQESRFVPASVSSSYALGMMQIMPFLIRHLAKEQKEELELEEMFNPYVAIRYGDRHLDYLTKYLYHPLFVAYGYNGGIGFTKKILTKRKLFRAGEYEPYLSMELVEYEESKEYGKKVLANYVIYRNLLGVPTKITPLIEELTDPLKTDKFR